MKRKRGNSKKYKKKVKLSVEGNKSEEDVVVELSDDDDDGSGSGNSSSEEEIVNNNNNNSNNNNGGYNKNGSNICNDDEKRDVVTPVVPVVSEKPPLPASTVVNVRPVGLNSRPPPMAVYGRVRLKLKTKPGLAPSPGPQLEKKVPLVDMRVGDSKGDKSKGEVKVGVEKADGGGNGGGEKAVEESKKSSGGMGIKIVSPKSSGLSPSDGNGEGDKIRQEAKASVEKMEDGGGKKVVEESGNAGAAERKKSGGMGLKITLSKGSALSPPGGNGEGGKSSQEGSVEKKEDGGGGEKMVEESKTSGSAESKKSGGVGVKIVSPKDLGLSPPVENAKESGEKEKEDGTNSGSAESKKPGGTGIKIVSFKGSGVSPPGGDAKKSGESKVSPEREEKEGGDSGSAESKKSGIKIMSSKDSDSNPPVRNTKESGNKEKEDGQISGSAESKKPGGTGIKIASLKSSGASPPVGNGKDSVEEKEGRDSGSVESKKFGGTGIKTVSSKELDSNPPSENAKENSENKVSPEKEEGEGRNLGPAESKKLGGVGIKIVSSKDGNAKEGGESNVSPEKEEKEEGNSGLAESNKSLGTGIKTVSLKGSDVSPPGRNAKESGESKVSPEKEQEKGEMMEVDVVEEKPKSLNRRELAASLEVVKKVMKMDAAELFNTPVNPVELGILDYFDVIKTPMDFGTVRSNLESGAKYMDSKDVYMDVQYIWDNCFKYNNKSDYIVDLMKRVKKNFIKYWVAAGLYTEHTKTIDSENNAVDDPTTSGHGKKYKKGKGYKLHKEDCLCAICIMRRRRREREAREAQEAREAGIFFPPPQIRISQTSMGEAYKQEKENSHAESPGGYTSPYIETSPDGDADTEMEDGERGLEGIASQYGNQHKADDDRMKFHDKFREISDKGDLELYETNIQDHTGIRMMNDSQKQPSGHPEEPAYGYLQQRNELLELEKKRQRLRLLETFRDLENPMLSGLCSTLFPNKTQKSVWNGANSLLHTQKPCTQKNCFHEAVASFISPSSKAPASLK